VGGFDSPSRHLVSGAIPSSRYRQGIQGDHWLRLGCVTRRDLPPSAQSRRPSYGPFSSACRPGSLGVEPESVPVRHDARWSWVALPRTQCGPEGPISLQRSSVAGVPLQRGSVSRTVSPPARRASVEAMPHLSLGRPAQREASRSHGRRGRAAGRRARARAPLPAEPSPCVERSDESRVGFADEVRDVVTRARIDNKVILQSSESGSEVRSTLSPAPLPLGSTSTSRSTAAARWPGAR
jgi:hypothetical protein